MKTKNYLLGLIALSGLFILASCEDDHDDHDHSGDCHACHIALPQSDGTEITWDILPTSGGTEFCGDELEDAESSSYSYAVSDTLYSDNGNIPLLPGEYGPGSADNSQYEIHCHHK